MSCVPLRMTVSTGLLMVRVCAVAQFAIAEEVVGESWYNVVLMGIWWEYP